MRADESYEASAATVPSCMARCHHSSSDWTKSEVRPVVTALTPFASVRMISAISRGTPQLTQVASEARVHVEASTLIELRFELRDRAAGESFAPPSRAGGPSRVDHRRRGGQDGDEPLVIAEVSVDADGGE